MININQTHKGTGDNVGGDKTVNNISEVKEKSSIPVWAQWIGWIIAILAFIWAIYIDIYPHL
ncbi:MAG: hypothetical protein HGA67_03410 [Candidatus Yonathbacteria bacterium]|nr:hypothetical protein [Candidatus Yonathbacteria bacterium]